jgi:hypothetical protein
MEKKENSHDKRAWQLFIEVSVLASDCTKHQEPVRYPERGTAGLPMPREECKYADDATG